MVTPIAVKTICIGKESTRGTANTSPTKYIAVTPDSEFEHKLNLLPDEMLRGGVRQEYPPNAGIKDTVGKISTDVESNNLGELFYSLLGTDTTTNPTAGVYQHIFTWDDAEYQRPPYTVFVKRTLGSAVTFDKRYVLSVVKEINLSQSVDGKLKANINLLSANEEASTFTFNPAFAAPDPFTFNDLTLKIPSTGSARTDIKDFQITFDNQSSIHRIFNQSQLPYDVITHKSLKIKGQFTLFFANLTDRNYFLANTSSDLSASWVGAEISGGYSKTLTILLRSIHYDAFPFGNQDDLLGATVTFNAFYSSGDSQMTQITLINADTDYSV